jgi:hypothetical protein
MKYFTAIISVILFLNCANTKQQLYHLEKQSPFKIEKATYHEWVAGVKGGGAGIDISLIIKEYDTTKVVLDSVFFRGKKAKIADSRGVFVAYFRLNSNLQEELIVPKNPQEKVLESDKAIKKFPFINLTNEEAVVSFVENNKTKYIKIKLTKTPSVLYQ